MRKNFPPDMLSAIRVAGVSAKLVLFSDPENLGVNDCRNCGGLGFFHVFIATDGPFQQPADPYRGDKKISHWHDGKWWVGKSYSFTCPDCKGLGYKGFITPAYKQKELA